MKRTIIAATAALLLTLSACSSGGSPASEPTPTPDGPPPGGISVRGVNDLRAAIEDAGYECGDYFMRDPSPMGADEFANCSDQLTFGVFPDQWAAEEWRSAVAGMGANVLVGDAWGVHGDYEILTDLETKIGGTLDEERTVDDIDVS